MTLALIYVLAAAAAVLPHQVHGFTRERYPRLTDYREDEDESYMSWKNKEARIQEYLARLREMRMAELQMRREQLEASAGMDITPVVVPPPRHRPQKWLPANADSYYQRAASMYRPRPDIPSTVPIKQQESSEFAVPPSDPRFFEQPKPHLVSEMVVTGPAIESDAAGQDDPSMGLSEFSKTTELLDEDTGVYKTPVTAYDDSREYMIFIAAVAGSSLFVVLMLGFIGIAIYKFQKNVKAAANVDYPAYGVTGPNSRDREATPTGDRKLAQSAQMYHYQITKQQILSMENNGGGGGGAESEADSEDENEEDYTVYECPGLAPAGEMEVKNPLFIEDPTPALIPTEAAPKEDQQESTK